MEYNDWIHHTCNEMAEGEITVANILLAEDSPTHTALMRSLLESACHKVHSVGDGRQALAAVEQSVPDLVITDLRMPEMNGLEVVQALAQRFPSIPAIVVTARGSENLAVDALALGAVNFIPKNSLQILLNHVVARTLQMVSVDRMFGKFSGRLLHPEFSFSLDSQVASIEPAVLFVIQSLAASTLMTSTHRIRVATATASAMFNAICFGNLEIEDEHTIVTRLLSGDESGEAELNQRADVAPFRDRRIQLKVSVGRKDTRVLVSHDGPGRMTRLTPAPGTPESFELEQCRGLMLMTSFMDDVLFHADSSEVVMVKRYGK